MGAVLVQYNDPYDNLLGVTPFGSNISRAWVLNEIGTATITLPLSTPNLTKIIAWGNIIRIHEYGVPVWVGIVEERHWQEGAVVLNLKSAEWHLTKKLTGQGVAFPAGSRSGTIAYGLFVSAYLNNCSLYNLKAGLFDGSKTRFKEPYNYADLYEAIKTLADEDGAAFWVDHKLALHYRDQRGTDVSATVKLREGKHLVNVRVSEQINTVVTAAVALGDGSEVTTRAKAAIQWVGNPSLFRAEVMTFSTSSDAALSQQAQEAIRQRGHPGLTVDAEFVKVDGTWGQFFVGSTIQVVLSTYPFQRAQTAKVIGIEMSGEDKMRLALEIIPSTSGFMFASWPLH